MVDQEGGLDFYELKATVASRILYIQNRNQNWKNAQNPKVSEVGRR